MAATSRAKAIKAVEAIFERYHLIASATSFNGHDKHVMENLRIVDASEKGTVDFELLISERYTNLNGVMHGGAAGVIFDMATTSALGPVARPGYWDFLGGVTRSLNISYLKAVPVNTTVLLQSSVQQHGRTMAFIRGTMTSLDGKTLYCTCEHHKVNVPTRPAHLGHRVEWDETWGEKAAGEADGKDKRGTLVKGAKL